MLGKLIKRYELYVYPWLVFIFPIPSSTPVWTDKSAVTRNCKSFFVIRWNFFARAFIKKLRKLINSKITQLLNSEQKLWCALVLLLVVVQIQVIKSVSFIKIQFFLQICSEKVFQKFLSKDLQNFCYEHIIFQLKKSVKFFLFSWSEVTDLEIWIFNALTP